MSAEQTVPSSTEHRQLSERAVIDRLHQLRAIVPAMAQEAADARREVSRLRRENRQLAGQLVALRQQTVSATTQMAR